jgi:hypothetical protein
VASTRDLPTIAFFRAGGLLRRSVLVPGILATHQPGAAPIRHLPRVLGRFPMIRAKLPPPCCLPPSVLVVVVVLRSRLRIEAVYQDGRRMQGESKRRDFRSDRRKTDVDKERRRVPSKAGGFFGCDMNTVASAKKSRIWIFTNSSLPARSPRCSWGRRLGHFAIHIGVSGASS